MITDAIAILLVLLAVGQLVAGGVLFVAAALGDWWLTRKLWGDALAERHELGRRRS